jgi:hypothetical protein
MAAPTIHLIFKTHLDIGFTDHAAKVRALYHERFIPQAIETGEHFYVEDPRHPMFIWTTGAWLLWDHLEHAGAARARRLERAIERGLVAWHALPFTTHSELMSPALFRAGLSYGAELDRRFGRTTIAAKMTDVPGHTRGIVPLLAEAGVKFLHLGVNEASPLPEVPGVFRWRAPGGEEVVVMYQDSYGSTHFPAGVGAGLSFAHTADNAGPQSVSQTIDVYRRLAAANPGTVIEASTLDAYADLLWARRDQLPVVDVEIGDSWIHGAGTDPAKLARFLALQRLYDRFAVEGLTPQRLAFGRALAMVPEHTWGVDIKTYLRDRTAWDRPALEAARRTDPRFAFTEASWTEQAAYLDTALAALAPTDRGRAADELDRLAAPTPTGETLPGSGQHRLGGWTVEVAPTGDIAALLAPSGQRLDGCEGSLLGFRYESYDAADVQAHLDSYLVIRPDWALLDHDKPGLDQAATAISATWQPALAEIRADGETLTLVGVMPARAFGELGAPRTVELRLAPEGAALSLTLTLRDKPANRMPEAGFLTFTPTAATAWSFLKLGLWQPAGRIARRAGGQLQAVSAVRAALPDGKVELAPLDTPLVTAADRPFMVFSAEPPDYARGVRFNLHNNKWGTNFPMWWSGTLVARFRLAVVMD